MHSRSISFKKADKARTGDGAQDSALEAEGAPPGAQRNATLQSRQCARGQHRMDFVADLRGEVDGDVTLQVRESLIGRATVRRGHDIVSFPM
jgi:hypothetical protein